MEKEKIFDRLSRVVLIVSGVIIIFSFFAPIIFVQGSFLGIDFNKTGPIGDTIGGIMNPFIALGGIFLTFLAFYIQLIANKQQRDSFRRELDVQKNQFIKNQFENQFYEMVRLHKENVNEISITLISRYLSGGVTVKNELQISGREVFKYFLNEINILYFLAKRIYGQNDKNAYLNMAYHIFFQGLDYELRKNTPSISNTHNTYIKELLNIRESNLESSTAFSNMMKKYDIKAERYNYKLFCGHSSLLAHYYRHLYQIVKFVANQDGELINYSEKRKYLRILRAQLSNQEQAMLFYNWKSDFGSTWENDNNHFFTDYRMIHNLYNDILIEDFNLVEIFKLNEDPYYKIEPDRKNDKLFEFQEW
jgi:hypothetical protein